MGKDLRGILTIPPVVYHKDLSVDPEGTARAVRFCLACGSHGLVMPVYASEYFVLSVEERKLVLEATLKENDGAVPVIAGVSAGYVAEAVDLARHAQSAGADALIAAPPHVVKVGPEELRDYYRQIDAAVHIPVIVQDLFPPLGTPMSADHMLRLTRELDNVCYIKEETARAPFLISELCAAMSRPEGRGLKGVLGGNGARDLVFEYLRGACGTMPPAQFADLAVAVWDLLEQGETARAMELHARCLPAFLYGGRYGVGCYKEILRQRGLDIEPICRPANWPALDRPAQNELRRILELVGPYLKVRL